MHNLGDVIKSLKEIERVSKKHMLFVSGENDAERNKFYKWTLIGTSILLKKSGKLFLKRSNLKVIIFFFC